MLVTKYGVPQGSILGPILYITYMNDVVRSSEILQFAIYADDTCVYNSNISATDNAQIMNGELKLVSRWLDRNCLTLNIKNVTMSTLRGKNVEFEREISIYWLINDVSLERCTFTKYLVVNIDENLTWNVHLNHVCKKVSKYVPVLFRIRNSLSRISLKMLYNCIIYPLFIYCNVVWGSAYKTYLRSIVQIQKKLVKIIAFKGRYEHEGPIFTELNFLTIEQI